MTIKKQRLVPNLDTAHSVPIEIDEYFIEEYEVDVMTICGIPIGYSKEKNHKIIGKWTQNENKT